MKTTKSVLHLAHYKSKNRIRDFMKIIAFSIKYVVFIFLCFGQTISCANKENTEKTTVMLNLKKEKSNDIDSIKKAQKAVVSANNKFALNLYSYLNSENSNENIFFSPYGVFTAMAMTYEGANGQTAKEMQSVFHFPTDNKVRRLAIASIYNLLNAPREGYRLLTANALWIQKNLKSEMFKEIQKYYGAKIFLKTSAKKVNQWIEHKTMNKFKNVVTDCQSTSVELCGLSLINTIYFKGDWKQEFKKSNTRKKLFIISNEETVKVPMMSMTKSFNYMETETMQMLEMPYKGEKLSMLVLLPKDFPGKPKKRNNRTKTVTNTTRSMRANLVSLEKVLTEENLKQWKDALLPEEVEVYIPKFTFKKNYKLSKILKQYMPLAFNEKKADFSKFAENIRKEEQNLYIKDIIHKSFVDVNEEGTEAAAVTVVQMGVTSVPPPPPIFKADHPFIFLIQERETGQILLIGKVVNPKIL